MLASVVQRCVRRWVGDCDNKQTTTITCRSLQARIRQEDVLLLLLLLPLTFRVSATLSASVDAP